MATKKKAQQELRRKTLRPHPVRDQILDIMSSYGEPISPIRLARVTGATVGQAAYHVRTLLAAGLIELADERRVRGAVEHLYALAPGYSEEVRVTDPIWQLMGACGALSVPGAEGEYPRPTVIDDPARERLGAILDQIRPVVEKIVREATDRADRASRRKKA